MSLLSNIFSKFAQKMVQYTYMGYYGKPKWSTQKDEAYIKEAYNKVVWVYACVAMIASCTASVPWILYRKGKTNGKLTEIPDHPILNIVNQQANPYLSSKDFFDMWATYLALQGKFYAEKNNPIIPTQLYPIYPHYMSPVPDMQRFISGFEFRMDGKAIEYKPENILWSKFNDPLDMYQGFSPIRAMARTIDTENEAVDWNKSMLQNCAVPPGAISAVNISPEVKEKLRDEWVNRYGGAKNSRVPLIFDAERVSYTNFGFNPIDMDFLEQRKLNRTEICAGFGVPSQVVGDPEGQTYANYEEAVKAFWQNTVIPKYLDHMKDKLNMDLCAMYADNLVLQYNLDDITVLHESLDSISERVRGLFKDNLLTQNEAREAIGYDKSADGDMFNFELASKAINLMQDNQEELTENEQEEIDEPKKKQIKAVNTEYYNDIEQRRNKYYKQLENSVKNTFQKERMALSKAYKQIADLGKMVSVTEKVLKTNKKNWINILTAAYLVVIEDFGKNTFKELVKQEKSVKMPEYDVYSTEVMKFISKTVGEKVTYIDDTTLARIKMIIDEGITEGLSIAKIASFIDKLYLDEIIPNRSKVISQTEIVSSSNYGSYSGALQSGANVLKQWLPAFDTRVRDSHLAMGAHPHIELDEKFIVGNSRMLYPADPNGAAEEVINCRCTIGYKRKE